jgi:hypothetical protein
MALRISTVVDTVVFFVFELQENKGEFYERKSFELLFKESDEKWLFE